MTISYLRDNVVKALQERMVKSTNRAIEMQVRQGDTSMPATTCEEYAMLQVQALTEARTYNQAIHMVVTEYAKMIEPEKVIDISHPTDKAKGSMY